MKFKIANKKIFYAGLVYFLCMVLFIGYRILWGTGIFGGVDANASDLIFAVCVQLLTFTLLPFLLYKLLTKQTLKQVGNDFMFKKINLPTVLYAILAGVLIYIIITFLSTLWLSILTMLGYSSSGGSAVSSNMPVWAAFIISVIATSLLPGFGEEIAHRGLILGTTKDNGLKRGILLSALLFGLAHLFIPQFGYAFIVGIILAIVTLITRSIFPAMIIHATSNFCSVYLGFANENGWFLGKVTENFANFLTNSPLLGMLVCFLLIMVVVSLLFMIFVRFFTHSKMQKFKQFCNNLKKETAGTELEKQINFEDKTFLFGLFTKAMAKDMEQKAEENNAPLPPSPSGDKIMIGSLLNSEQDTYSKVHKLDYLFYYMAIFLGAIITIFTFIWGIL